MLYHWGRLLPLAQTALFSTAFSANLYFWLTTGYFQPTSHENPLLHLWSLGIEEQFYILAPLALLLLWKAKRTLVVPAIVVGILVSLVACIVVGELGESTTAFYILPTRAWELLAGASICMLPSPRASTRSAALGITGILAIATSYWMLGTEGTVGRAGTSVAVSFFGLAAPLVTPFPGWVTVPSIAGTMLLIRYAEGGAAGRLLSSAPFVGIGKISYSLYLWHWPVLVFGGYVTYGRQSVGLGVALILLSFLCAYASWRWIETPFRTSRTFTSRRAFSFAALGGGGLALACTVLIAAQGLRDVVNESANLHAPPPRPFLPNLQKLAPPKPAFRPLPYPDYDRAHVAILGDPAEVPGFCLIGDSHAEAIAPGIHAAAADRRRSGYYFTASLSPYGKRSGPGPYRRQRR